MRVHELAKELDLSSKELLSDLQQRGVDAKSHMSALSLQDVDTIRSKRGDGAAAPPESVQVRESELIPSLAEKTKGQPHFSGDQNTSSDPLPKAFTEVSSQKPLSSQTSESRSVIIKGPIVVKEFSAHLNMRPNQLIAELMSMNIFASINERLDLKVAQKVAEKHGIRLEYEKKSADRKPMASPPSADEEPEEDKLEDLVPRPPVITFLGHVDHGKTSLLDQIREAKVAQGEDGGITQYIGAYTIDYQGQKITFIDTPGHEAFTAMRARGANLTDIAVIVIAADDGIKSQTREALQHIRAAGVSIMVAINKVDLKTANVDKVKQQLQEENLTPEEWGGETICCPVSAHTGEGIDHLLEMILLQAEILELKSNPKRKAQGYVVEACLETGMGPTASLLVKRGILHVGDVMVCGPYWGRIKALINDQGVKIEQAGPSMAVKCLGLPEVPDAGSEFKVYPNDRLARSISEKRLEKKRNQTLTGSHTGRKATLDDLLKQTDATSVKELSILIKADVQGILEAIQQSVRQIKSDKITQNIILGGVGNITGNDVLLASASNAIILGFHVSKEGQVNKLAKHEGVEIRLYNVIYELLDDVRQAMEGLLEPELRENITGHAQVKQVFDISKKGKIAGCLVTDGRVTIKAFSRVLREGDVLCEARILTLKRYQNEASDVRDGQECGIRLDNFSDFNEGDIIEFYETEQIAQTL
ncbi:MAG: translation initiation factor IF-2 [Kiritimatiellae bacterium]|nr:translation initiation factor IF-2 [Kiritimatiellia bacterium]